MGAQPRPIFKTAVGRLESSCRLNRLNGTPAASWFARPKNPVKTLSARRPETRADRWLLFAMMRRAGQHERDSGVDGEGGSAFGGSARPRASLGSALPGIA